ncbi:unnamed protein product [Leptosia nina]|uniref:Uncharacterized protein n=1 Tax=Leptosia nina TaxID=320188 RepID=A0AAV1IY92_9NEOP
MSRHAYDKKIPSESTALTSNFESKEATDRMTRKCFRIKDLKLILSDRFLHLRIKNPAPLIKDVYTHLSHLVEKKDTKASIKINLDKGNFGPATNDKGITVLPIQQSCSCQCLDDTMIQGRGTRMRRKKEKKERTPQSPHNKTPSSDISLYSSLSLTSQTDDTKTSTTICSRLEVDYIEEKPRRTAVRRVKKVKVNVATKTNQATTTDKTQICDVSTITDDWWSPLVERKPMKFHDEAGDHRYRTRKSRGVATDKRIVKFLSRAQIIPRDTCDILSPSRYLLESQKYYNELFSSRLFTPHLFPSIVTKGTKHALEKSHSDETPRSRVQAKVKSSKKNRA